MRDAEIIKTPSMPPDGGYVVRYAVTADDLDRARRFRARCFELNVECDVDAFDDVCVHVVIENAQTRSLACAFRMLTVDPAEIARSYAATFYDLDALLSFEGPLLEVGRFCVKPGLNDPDVLRLAWGVITATVDQQGISLLFGCSSFSGIDTDRYLDTFALLKSRHLAPTRWRPKVKALNVFRFSSMPRTDPDIKTAMGQMPPLLRTYLLMGGWVSDHAVLDHEMNTLHVFTGVEVSTIPSARKRLLRVLAAQHPRGPVSRAK